MMNGEIEAGPAKHDDSELPSTYQTTMINYEESMVDESTALFNDGEFSK